MAHLNGFNAHEVDPNVGFDPIPAGKKSLALSLELRAPDRTLTGDEADRAREVVKGALAAKLGASFRG